MFPKLLPAVWVQIMYIILYSSVSAQFCQESSRNPYKEFIVNSTDSFTAPLSEGLPQGSYLVIEGKVTSSARSVVINLILPEHKRFIELPGLALFFISAFEEGRTVFNSLLDEEWGQELSIPRVALKKEEHFKITIHSEKSEFKIFINDVLFTSYQHRTSPDHIAYIQIIGGVYTEKVIYQFASVTCQADPELYTYNLPILGVAPSVSYLEGNLIPGSSLSISGLLHSNAEWFVINLQSDGAVKKEIALQLNQRLKENSVIRNTFTAGSWGHEERHGPLALQKGQYFIITFHCEQNQFKICINGQLYTTYKHRVDPRIVTKVYITGEMTLNSVVQHTPFASSIIQQPSINTECCSSQESSCCFGKNLIKQEIAVPTSQHYTANLTYGFNPGSILFFSGKISTDLDWGVIDLRADNNNGETDFVALHFNLRFYENIILRDTFLGGVWGKGEYAGGIPVHKGEPFTITMTCEEHGIKICINGKFFTHYKHRVDTANINTLRVDGAFSLADMRYFKISASSDRCSTVPNLHELMLPTPTSGQYVTGLADGFNSGSMLVLTGKVLSSPNWGVIDIRSDPSGIIALHFNIRFNENAVIRSTFVNGVWGNEEREGGMPFHVGENFNVTISCNEQGMKIFVDNVLFTFYKHRVPTDNINTLRVDGALGLTSAKYYTLSNCCKICMENDHVQHKLPVPTPEASEYKTVLNHGFNPGSILAFTGEVKKNVNWGVIDIRSLSGVIALHFNLRFKENTIIQNTFMNDEWGNEERKGIPFSKGEEFNITISCYEQEMEICINNLFFSNYKHRVDTKSINRLRVGGAFSVKEVKYYTNKTEVKARPVFTNCPSHVTVKEEQPIGTSLLQVSAEGDDQVTYSISDASKSKPKFRINPDSGVITTNHVFDWDEPNREREYYMVVTATGSGNLPLEDSCIIRVDIENINDNSPCFAMEQYGTGVAINTKVGSVLTRVLAGDRDEQEVTLTINSTRVGNDQYFGINSHTGEIKLNKKIDKHVGYQFKLYIIATDKEAPFHQALAEISFIVTSNHEQIPRFLSFPTTIQMREYYTDFTIPLATFTASSNMGGDKVEYELISGCTESSNGLQTFILNNNNGTAELHLQNHLRYKSVPEYKLAVSAKNSLGFSTIENMYIAVMDSNSHVPQFIGPTTGRVTLPHNQGDIVFKVYAIDADVTAPHNKVSYKLANNTDLFEIDSNTGYITTKVPLTCQHEDVYHLRIVAQDGSPSDLDDSGEPNTAEEIIQIEVISTNINQKCNSKAVKSSIILA